MTSQKQWFDKRAADFDKEFFSPCGPAVTRRFSSLKAVKSTTDTEKTARCILEIGSGTGIYSQQILGLSPDRLIATDISRPMLDIAKNKLSDKRLLGCVNQAESLPFADNSFDSVWAFACFHHVGNTQSGFNEVSRVLKKDGDFFLMEPNNLFPLNILLALIKTVERGMLDSRPERWIPEAERAGLRCTNYRCGSFFPGWSFFALNFFEQLEKYLEQVPVLSKFGICHYYHFTK